MTYETYVKASEIRSEMDYLVQLECLIENACKDKFLATISNYKFEDARNIVVKECKVLNHISLSNDLREKMLKLIREEYDKLREEFKQL